MSPVEIDQNKNSDEYWNPTVNQKEGWTPHGRRHKTYIAPSKIGSVELEAPAGSSHRDDVSPSVQVDAADEEVVLGTRFSNFRVFSIGIAAGPGEAFRRTSSCQCWWP